MTSVALVRSEKYVCIHGNEAASVVLSFCRATSVTRMTGGAYRFELHNIKKFDTLGLNLFRMGMH